jgi:azurin
MFGSILYPETDIKGIVWSKAHPAMSVKNTMGKKIVVGEERELDGVIFQGHCF